MDCFGLSPSQPGQPEPSLSLAPGGMRWWSAVPPAHPPKSGNPRIPQWRAPQRSSNSSLPSTRPSYTMVLVWPQGWKSQPGLPCASHRSHEKTSNSRSTWPLLVPKQAEKGSGAAFSQPRAKPASSLRRSENRVHWKSAKLQYIGISICQLLNSKTDCLKTESVSYSKFTLNSSPFLHL